MGTRNGQSYFWSEFLDFLDDDILSRADFFKQNIHRIQDSVIAGRDYVFGLAQQLGSTNAGTSALQRGTVIMGTLAFYDPIDTPTGDLDGKTLTLGTDLAGPVTVTFTQPISPAHVATQINTQAAALGLVAAVDNGVDPNTGAVVAANVGKLLLTRPSGGGASLTVYGSGTANGILGLPLIDTTTNGTGTVNDGASRIGLAAFGSWVGGPLRTYLITVANSIDATLTSYGGVLPQANTTLSAPTTQRTVYRIPTLAASYEYTLPSAPSGYSIIFVMNPPAGADTATIKRPDTTTIAIMNGLFNGAPGQQFVRVTMLGGVWSVESFGITDNNYLLPA